MCAKKRKKLTGIDVGATGIKGATVHLETGELLSERIKFPTPVPATPGAIAQMIKQICKELGTKKGALVGCGFPSVVVNGVTRTASNIDRAWINQKAEKFLSEQTQRRIHLLNDADGAGLAELKFGHVPDAEGIVILLTLGTGIGSALFINGELIPNTEFGHMPFKRSVAEDYVSNRARKARELGYKRWGKELNIYLTHLVRMFHPDLIIIGGGVSKRYELYSKYIDPGVKVVPARLLNNAGIVGAALYADKRGK